MKKLFNLGPVLGKTIKSTKAPRWRGWVQDASFTFTDGSMLAIGATKDGTLVSTFMRPNAKAQRRHE